MDSNTTLIIINVIISLIHLADTFIIKLKNSKCILGELNMKEDIENKKNDKINLDQIDINKLNEILKINNKKDNLDKKDDIENKL